MAGLLEGWTLEDGLLLEDMVPEWKDFAGVCRNVHLVIYIRMMELCVCYTEFLFYYISFCVQSKGKFLLFIDSVLYFVIGRQDYPGWQDFTGGQGSSRVTGGQAFDRGQGRTPVDGRSLLMDVFFVFFCWSTGLHWKVQWAVHLCVRMMELCVHVLCVASKKTF